LLSGRSIPRHAPSSSSLTGQRDTATAERDTLRVQVASQLTVIDTFTNRGNGAAAGVANPAG
jgi:hypothetical protein